MKRTIDFIVVHCHPSERAQAASTAQANNTLTESHYQISARAALSKALPETRNSQLGVTSGNECLCITVTTVLYRNGRPALTRAQEAALFDKIVELTERHPQARVVGKEYFDGKAYQRHVFDLRSWLASYVPDVALAA